MSALESLPSHIPVLIVGGGPVGITCALLLAEQGVESLVIEKGDALPSTPRAHVIRRRSMEIFEKIGVADAVEKAVPGPETRHITWVAQLAGKEIGRLNLLDENLDFSWTNLPQNLLCPVLLDKIRSSQSAHITTHAECVAGTEQHDSITAQVQFDGSTHEINAKWLIAADGAGSPTREKIGIQMAGTPNLAEFYMVHFKADLTLWIQDRPSPIFWVLNPEAGGTLIVHELEKSHVFMVPAQRTDGSEESLKTHIAAALGTEIPLEILSSGIWTASSEIAETYRKGRVFLVGDAAHRFPPSGGLGLNTGILDAHNLAWKLALVEKGIAEDALLDSYTMECQPVAVTNAEASVHNMATLAEVHEVLGRHKTLASLEQRLETLSPDERAALQTAIDNQTSHFVSDGILPGTWQGAAHPPLGLPRSYGAFKLIVQSPPKWAAPVRALEQKFGVRIETFIQLQVKDPEHVLTRDQVVLLRPDDQIAGIGKTPADIEAVLAATLAGPTSAATTSEIDFKIALA